MKKPFLPILFLSFWLIPSCALAFQFITPTHGMAVPAGSTLEVEIDTGEITPLLSVLFTTSRGIVKARLDSLKPYKWSIKIPKNYYGPLTLRAVGRRYYPIPNPPRASVTIFVVSPVIRIKHPF